MKCPKCRRESQVLRTIEKRNVVIRYHRCKYCGFRFKTVEMYSYNFDYLSILKKIKELVSDVEID